MTNINSSRYQVFWGVLFGILSSDDVEVWLTLSCDLKRGAD